MMMTYTFVVTSPLYSLRQKKQRRRRRKARKGGQIPETCAGDREGRETSRETFSLFTTQRIRVRAKRRSKGRTQSKSILRALDEGCQTGLEPSSLWSSQRVCVLYAQTRIRTSLNIDRDLEASCTYTLVRNDTLHTQGIILYRRQTPISEISSMAPTHRHQGLHTHFPCCCIHTHLDRDTFQKPQLA